MFGCVPDFPEAGTHKNKKSQNNSEIVKQKMGINFLQKYVMCALKQGWLEQSVQVKCEKIVMRVRAQITPVDS